MDQLFTSISWKSEVKKVDSILRNRRVVVEIETNFGFWHFSDYLFFHIVWAVVNVIKIRKWMRWLEPLFFLNHEPFSFLKQLLSKRLTFLKVINFFVELSALGDETVELVGNYIKINFVFYHCRLKSIKYFIRDLFWWKVVVNNCFLRKMRFNLCWNLIW